MQQKFFNIENYDVTDTEIVATTERYKIAIPVTIPRDKFELWLRVKGKLQWTIHTGGKIQQFTGTMSLPEYWAIDQQHIKQDIYEYIILHPIKRDGAVYSNSIDSLLLAFDLHNSQRVNPVFNTRWEFEQEIFEQVLN